MCCSCSKGSNMDSHAKDDMDGSMVVEVDNSKAQEQVGKDNNTVQDILAEDNNKALVAC